MLIKVLATKGVKYTLQSQTSQSLVPEIAIEKLKRHKATGVDHIPSKLIQAGGGNLYEEIHKLIVLICNKAELSQECKESIIVPIHKTGNRMDCNNYGGISF